MTSIQIYCCWFSVNYRRDTHAIHSSRTTANIGYRLRLWYLLTGDKVYYANDEVFTERNLSALLQNRGARRGAIFRHPRQEILLGQRV